MAKKVWVACEIPAGAFQTKRCKRYLSPFIGWMTLATARPAARVWACRLRTGPSGCMAGNFAHPTAKRVGCRLKFGFRLVVLLRGLLFPLIPDTQICFSHKLQSP